jgi:parvulin-like peptidyl-prolyl isomerase
VKRLLAAAGGALVLCMGATACGSNNSPAATVNGTELSRSDFDADLAAYSGNQAFLATGQAGENAQGGSVSNDFARKTLRDDILFEIIRQEVARRRLMLPSLDDADVRAETIGRFDQSGSPDIFNAFPESFRTRALRQTANVIALERALGHGPVDDAKVRQTYDADPRRFAELCVAHIALQTEQEAKSVLAQLRAGADFARLARTKSLDESATNAGGKLTNPDGSCPRASDVKDAVFLQAALKAAPGQLAGPVKTSAGWDIIKVVKLTVLPFDTVQTAVRAAADQAVVGAARPAINAILTTGLNGKITVDPRYGVWDPVGHQIGPPGFRPTPRGTTTT